MINLHKQWRTLKIALRLGLLGFFPVEFFCCCLIISLEVFWMLKLPSFVECFFSLFLLHFCFVIIAAMNLVLKMEWGVVVSYFGSNTFWQVRFILGVVIFSLSLPCEQQTTIEFFVTVHKQVRAECYDTVPKSGTAFTVVSSLSPKNGLYVWKPYR